MGSESVLFIGTQFSILYTSMYSITFVLTNNEDRLFFLQEQWTELQHIICNDSIALAIVYRNKQEQLVMGIYDLLRASGVSYEDHNIFHRQKCLFSMFAQKNIRVDYSTLGGGGSNLARTHAQQCILAYSPVRHGLHASYQRSSRTADKI
jgi:hypothetical protein